MKVNYESGSKERERKRIETIEKEKERYWISGTERRSRNILHNETIACYNMIGLKNDALRCIIRVFSALRLAVLD